MESVPHLAFRVFPPGAPRCVYLWRPARVSFAVWLTLTADCAHVALTRLKSARARKQSAHAYSVYYGVRWPTFSISSRIENTQFLKIYWHDPAKTFPIDEWNLP